MYFSELLSCIYRSAKVSVLVYTEHLALDNCKKFLAVNIGKCLKNDSIKETV